MPVYVNEVEHHLFHFRNLTISDALLAAGINLKKFNGKPGLGSMITVNGTKKTFRGTMGSLARVSLNGMDAALDTPVHANCRIKIIPGDDGKPPQLKLNDVIDDIPSLPITINGADHMVAPRILINGAAVEPKALSTVEINDGDVIETRMPRTVGETLRNAGYPPSGRRINYTLNGRSAHYTCSPKIILNEATANIALPIKAGDVIEYDARDAPKIADIVNAQELVVKFFYEGDEYSIPATDIQIKLNGRPATLNAIVDDEAIIQYKAVQRPVIVSDALLAIDFKAPDARSRTKFEIKLNGVPSEFTSPLKTGDTLEITLKLPEEIDDQTSKGGGILNGRESEARVMPVEEKTSARFKNMTIADLIRKD